MPLKLVPPRAGKSPNWSIRGTYMGVYVDRSAGTPSKAVAQKKLQALQRDIERGELAPAAEPTFLEAALAYLKAGGERRFIQPIIDDIGPLKLSKVTAEEVVEVAARLYPPGITAEPSARNGTINRCVFTPISAVMRHAGRPLALRRPKQAAPRVNWITPEEAAAWLKAASPKLARLTTFLLYTGCRIGEAVNLKGEQVDRRAALAFLSKTKAGHSRGVHLPPPVLAELPETLKPGERVFGYRDRWEVYDDWNPLRSALNFPSWWTPHACCHTWATWMRQYAGMDLRGLLGTARWRDLKSVLRYQHVDTTAESRAADLLPQLVENPGKKKRKSRKSAA